MRLNPVGPLLLFFVCVGGNKMSVLLSVVHSTVLFLDWSIAHVSLPYQMMRIVWRTLSNKPTSTSDNKKHLMVKYDGAAQPHLLSEHFSAAFTDTSNSNCGEQFHYFCLILQGAVKASFQLL